MKENYYIAVDDGEHFNIFERRAIVEEATVVFNETVAAGPEGRWEEVEMGYWDEDDEDCEMEPLLYHSFEEKN